MVVSQAYQEVINFIASGGSPSDIVAFQPSPEAKARVFELIAKKKAEPLSAEEANELDHFLQLEHPMRLNSSRP